MLHIFFSLQYLLTSSLAFLSPHCPHSLSSADKYISTRPFPVKQTYLIPEVSSWIATIDSDIANIPDNEFAPVFMGGVAVMFGGLFSAFAVGTMIEKGDLYANVIAESYGQGGENNEEFWKGISEEDRLKGMEILKELEAKKNGGEELTNIEKEAIAVLSANKDMALSVGLSPSSSQQQQKIISSDSDDVSGKNRGAHDDEIDMFSDYD